MDETTVALAVFRNFKSYLAVYTCPPPLKLKGSSDSVHQLCSEFVQGIKFSNKGCDRAARKFILRVGLHPHHFKHTGLNQKTISLHLGINRNTWKAYQKLNKNALLSSVRYEGFQKTLPSNRWEGRQVQTFITL